jgi:hypothetical protein
MFTTELTYYSIVLFFSIGLFVSSLEFLMSTQLFASYGLNSWDIIQLRWSSGLMHNKLFAHLFGPNGMKAILVVRILLVVSLQFLSIQSAPWMAVICALAGSYLITNINTFYGSDGSDQMNNIILVVLVTCTMSFVDQAVMSIGLFFIAAQACFSYFAAGVSKLVSPKWRDGTAVTDIFKTRTYGSQLVFNYLRGKKSLGYLLCWSVIVMEVSFPIVLFLPVHWGIFIIAWGVVFHLLNAAIMGLNSFLWAFLATYPAIFYTHQQIELWLLKWN